MPRSVPTIDGAGQRKEVTVSYIDFHNRKRTDSYIFDQAMTDAQIEAFIVALAAASNADIYKVEVQQVYSAVANSGNALDADQSSVRENIVLLFKNGVTNDGRDYFIPAPKDALLVDGSEIVDTADALLLAVRDAIDAGLNNYVPVTARFTRRRTKNAARSI